MNFTSDVSCYESHLMKEHQVVLRTEAYILTSMVIIMTS